MASSRSWGWFAGHLRQLTSDDWFNRSGVVDLVNLRLESVCLMIFLELHKIKVSVLLVNGLLAVSLAIELLPLVSTTIASLVTIFRLANIWLEGALGVFHVCLLFHLREQGTLLFVLLAFLQ